MGIYKGEIRIGIREKISLWNKLAINNDFTKFYVPSQVLIKRKVCSE